MNPGKEIFYPKWKVSIIILIAFVFISCFEILKQFLLPDISLWQSHTLTILVFTTFVAYSSFHIKKLMKNFQKQIVKLEGETENLKMQNGENAIRLKNKKDWEKTFDAIDDWISIIDLESSILRSNRTVEKYFQLSVQKSIGSKCCKLLHGTDTPIEGCPIPKMLQTKKRESAEVKITDGRWMLITIDPIFNGDGDIVGAVHIARDITQRILIQDEREILVQDLKEAMTRIKTLSGLIPICAHCKKIRDDKGYWNLIESYIESHSDAAFSHSMCPECSDKLYGNEDWYIEMKKDKRKK